MSVFEVVFVFVSVVVSVNLVVIMLVLLFVGVVMGYFAWAGMDCSVFARMEWVPTC